jgi:hypothetical protein
LQRAGFKFGSYKQDSITHAEEKQRGIVAFSPAIMRRRLRWQVVRLVFEL